MGEHGSSWVKLIGEEEEMEYYFPHLRAVLERDMELWKPFYTMQEVLDLIRQGGFQLWVGWKEEIEIYAITEVSVSKRAKILTVMWCGGHSVRDYFERFFRGLETYASLIEADFIYINGRSAWVKLLKSYGYEPAQVCLRKEVQRGAETAVAGYADDGAEAFS